MSKQTASKMLLCLLLFAAAALVVMWHLQNLPRRDTPEELRAKDAAQHERDLHPQYTLPTPQSVPPALSPEGRSLATGAVAPAPFDLDSYLSELSNPATREQALARAASLPEAAIVPMSEALAADRLPAPQRMDITTALAALYNHASQARLAEDKRAAQAWRDATGVLTYKKYSDTPQLDACVFKAFEDLNGGSVNAVRSLNIAVNAGTRDPLIRAFQLAQSNESFVSPPPKFLHDYDKLLKELDASHYSAGRRILANLDFLRHAASPKCPPDITPQYKRQLLDRTMALFPQLAAENPGRQNTNAILDALYIAANALFDDHTPDSPKRAFDAYYPALSAALPDNALVAGLELDFYKDWASDARATHWAYTVTPQGRLPAVTQEGWQLFGQRLAAAHAVGEAKWRLDPLNADIPADMVMICAEQGTDRDEMEVWFSRAIAANPHNLTACRNKLEYLHAMQPDTELEFARWCVKHGDSSDRIPSVMMTIQENLAFWSGDRTTYFTRPEVWADLQSAFKILLADKPLLASDNPAKHNAYLHDRGSYLLYAYRCQQWKTLLDLDDQFGGEVDYAPLGGERAYDNIKAKAAATLHKFP